MLKVGGRESVRPWSHILKKIKQECLLMVSRYLSLILYIKQGDIKPLRVQPSLHWRVIPEQLKVMYMLLTILAGKVG